MRVCVLHHTTVSHVVSLPPTTHPSPPTQPPAHHPRRLVARPLTSGLPPELEDKRGNNRPVMSLVSNQVEKNHHHHHHHHHHDPLFLENKKNERKHEPFPSKRVERKWQRCYGLCISRVDFALTPYDCLEIFRCKKERRYLAALLPSWFPKRRRVLQDGRHLSGGGVPNLIGRPGTNLWHPFISGFIISFLGLAF